jgi:iron complex outermembrane recepter protein
MRRFPVRSLIFQSLCVALPCIAPAMAQTNTTGTDNSTPVANTSTSTTTAAQSSSAGSGADGKAKTLGVVTVSAEKTQTDLQKTPITVSTIDGQTLTEQGLTTAVQATSLMPGVEWQNANSGGSFYIRGIGTKVVAFGSPSPIGTYIDGVYEIQPPIIAGAMSDVDNVEVLRGPQGTIYGRNSTGGAVNIITNDPVLNELSDQLILGGGNYATVHAENILNLPLSDWAALRVDLDKQSHDGYLSNGLDDADQDNVRAKLLLQPTKDLRIVVSATEYNQHNLGTGNVVYPLAGRDPWTASAYNTAYSGCSPNCMPYNNILDHMYSLHVDWDLGPAKLTYIYGHEDYLYSYLQTFSGLWEYKTIPLTQDSNELRLASTGEGPLHWVTGLYYYNGNSSGGIDNIFTFDSYTTTQTAVDRSKAAFAQLTYDLTDTLHLVGGVRYTHDSVRQYGYLGTTADPYPADGWAGGAANFHYFSYKAGVDWDYTPHAMLYANYSTASSEGGFNQYTGPYAPEHIRAFEIGSKNRWLDDRLQLNSDVYYYWYNNYQLSYPHYLTDGNIEVFTTDVSGVTTVDGAESELDYLLTDHDRISGWANYNHTSFGEASITENCATGGPTCLDDIDLKGQPLPQAPKRSARLAYEHYFNFGDGSSITAHVDGQYKSGSFVDIYRFEGSFINPATLWNARVTYYSADDRWSLGLYINNIGNKAVLQQANPAGSQYMAMYGDPRTFGATFSLKLF